MSQNFLSLESGRPAVDIRPANPADASQIVELLRAVYTRFEAHFAPTALRWTPEDVAASIEDWLVAVPNSAARSGAAAQRRTVGVVRHAEDPLGYTFDALAVHPDYQRRAIGTLLVLACEDQARVRGRSHVAIALRLSLEPTIEFFVKRGYSALRPFGERHRLYGKDL